MANAHSSLNTIAYLPPYALRPTPYAPFPYEPPKKKKQKTKRTPSFLSYYSSWFLLSSIFHLPFLPIPSFHFFHFCFPIKQIKSNQSINKCHAIITCISFFSLRLSVSRIFFLLFFFLEGGDGEKKDKITYEMKKKIINTP